MYRFVSVPRQILILLMIFWWLHTSSKVVEKSCYATTSHYSQMAGGWPWQMGIPLDSGVQWIMELLAPLGCSRCIPRGNAGVLVRRSPNRFSRGVRDEAVPQ